MPDRHTTHAVLARFAHMTSARRGIAALERAGIPGSDIRLEGRAAQEARDQSDTSTSDKAFVHEVDRTVVTGAAIGAGAGGLVGLVAGLLVLDPSWPAIVAPVAGGIAGGGGLGLVITPIVALPQTDAAELTYHAVDTMDVCVTVRTNDGHEASTAASCLRRTNAVSVEQQDANGTPLHT